MIFNPRQQKSNLTGTRILGTCYTDPNLGPSHITTVTHLRYLGVYIDHRLDWMHHITIMANRAWSNI
jgi:hypothetical protein